MVWHPEFLVIVLGPIRTMWLAGPAVIPRLYTLYGIGVHDLFDSADRYQAFQCIVYRAKQISNRTA